MNQTVGSSCGGVRDCACSSHPRSVMLRLDAILRRATLRDASPATSADPPTRVHDGNDQRLIGKQSSRDARSNGHLTHRECISVDGARTEYKVHVTLD